MPSSYAMMDEEEMTYVEGGYSFSTYKSWDAWQKISSMLSSVSTWSGSTVALVGVAAGTGATGVGLVVAILSALGASLTSALGGIQVAMTGCALTYAISSWHARGFSNSGFRAADLGLFKWDITAVKPL